MSEAEQIIEAETTGSITANYSDFSDFVQKNNYQFGPHFSAESLKQQPDFAHGEVDHNKVYALSVAKNIGEIKEGSVALNQTINTATVALAEQDPNDPNSGHIHYVAFVQGSHPRTYVFTENVTIDSDGTMRSQMEQQGQGWDTADYDEQGAYTNLVKQFADVAVTSDDPSLIAAFEKSSGRDLAMGGIENSGGEYEVRHEGGRAAVASASDFNAISAVEIESSYGVGGDAQMKLTLFRGNADNITQMQASAPGVDNQAKYESFSQMTPGINVLKP